MNHFPPLPPYGDWEDRMMAARKLSIEDDLEMQIDFDEFMNLVFQDDNVPRDEDLTFEGGIFV